MQNRRNVVSVGIFAESGSGRLRGIPRLALLSAGGLLAVLASFGTTADFETDGRDILSVCGIY
jgi:hypothetical protein